MPGCQTDAGSRSLLAAADEIFSAFADQVLPVDTAAGPKDLRVRRILEPTATAMAAERITKEQSESLLHRGRHHERGR